MVKAVIFDMGGTLIDSVDLHAKAWQDAFRDFGREFDFKAIRGRPSVCQAAIWVALISLRR